LAENTPEKKAYLHESYEELRAYALSAFKNPSQPLGLDLWIKKGFLSWCIIMLRKDVPVTPILRVHKQHTPAGTLAADLTISLSNILSEWSSLHGGQQNKERAFNTQGVPLHTAIHPSSGV